MVIKVLRVILPDAVDHRGHIRVGLRSLLIVVADHPDAVLLSAPINTTAFRAFAKIGESGVQHDANTHPADRAILYRVSLIMTDEPKFA